MVVAYERPPTLAELMVLCKICGAKGCSKDHAGGGDVAALEPEELDGLNLDQLTERFRKVHGTLESVGRRSLDAAYSLGLVLERVQRTAGHGKWLGWCENEGIEPRTARRYVTFRKAVGERDNLSDLPADTSVRGAMALLAEKKAGAPKTPPRLFPVATPADITIRELDAAALPSRWDGRVDLVITSWPYVVGQTQAGYVDFTDYAAFTSAARRWVEALWRVLAPNGRVCLNLPIDTRCSGKPEPIYAHALEMFWALGFRYETTIVWAKAENGQTGRSSARGSATPPHPTPNAPCVTHGTELILVAHKGQWNLDRAGEENDLGEDEALDWTNGHWVIGGAHDKRYPHVFPLELVTRLAKLFSFPGDTLGDFHCGSGTTAVTAATNGRKFLGGDLNPQAVALSTQRVAEALKGAGGGQ